MESREVNYCNSGLSERIKIYLGTKQNVEIFTVKANPNRKNMF